MELVCILETSDQFEALAAQELLEANGIDCLLPQERQGAVMPHLTATLAPQRLFVHPDIADEARTLIQDFSLKSTNQPTIASTQDPPTYSENRCPRCGSHSYERAFSLLNVINLLILGALNSTRVTWVRFRCQVCSKRWTRRE